MLRDFPIASFAKLKCWKQLQRKIQRSQPSQGRPITLTWCILSREDHAAPGDHGATQENAHNTVQMEKAGYESISTSITRI